MAIQPKIDITGTLGKDLYYLGKDEKKVYERNQMTGKNEPTGEVYYLYHIATTVGDAVDISCPEAYDFELFEALELVNATSSYYGRSQQDSTYVEMRSSYSCEAMKPLGLKPEWKRFTSKALGNHSSKEETKTEEAEKSMTK
ncbi:hypothetical protein V109_02143 [Staphylococcus aureus Chi-10]|uniref:hypothetical protein n=1 Tax=Staphylococcus aureus TaxID=1280 RepID=UPI0004524AF6|nr:hypothetical protein [Staphylococcus aureus]EZX71391.1 hypothetical protein V109_02143 [Staphylococcus aureus Chi-10]